MDLNLNLCWHLSKKSCIDVKVNWFELSQKRYNAMSVSSSGAIDSHSTGTTGTPGAMDSQSTGIPQVPWNNTIQV